MNDQREFAESEMVIAAAEATALERLLNEETGGVLLEYIILLLGAFMSLSLTVTPLQDALLWFAAQVFDHLHYA
jgi:hypothetical protein